MRPTTWFSLTATLIISLSGMARAQSPTPSLGDFARAVRKAKAPASSGKVYDNDNLPGEASLSVVGAQTSHAPEDKTQEVTAKTDTPPAESSATGDEKTREKKPSGEIKSGQTTEEREEAYAVWKGKIEGQKRTVELATRELDVVQREYRLRTAQYYADPAARLRNPAQWDEEDAKYKREIQDKQKALESARSKLGDLEEQARKAGVPSSDR